MTGDWSIEELSSRRPRQSRFDRLSPRLTEGSTQGALLPATWPVDGAAAFKAAYVAQEWSKSSMRSTRGMADEIGEAGSDVIVRNGGDLALRTDPLDH